MEAGSSHAKRVGLRSCITLSRTSAVGGGEYKLRSFTRHLNLQGDAVRTQINPSVQSGLQAASGAIPTFNAMRGGR